MYEVLMFKKGFVSTEMSDAFFLLGIQQLKDAPNLSASGHREKQAALVRLSTPGRIRGANRHESLWAEWATEVGVREGEGRPMPSPPLRVVYAFYALAT